MAFDIEVIKKKIEVWPYYCKSVIFLSLFLSKINWNIIGIKKNNFN